MASRVSRVRTPDGVPTKECSFNKTSHSFFIVRKHWNQRLSAFSYLKRVQYARLFGLRFLSFCVLDFMLDTSLFHWICELAVSANQLYSEVSLFSPAFLIAAALSCILASLSSVLFIRMSTPFVSKDMSVFYLTLTRTAFEAPLTAIT